jgi:DNA polymerase (family 10)
MINKRIAEMFNEIALMLQVKNENGFKFEIRAYQRGALTIDSLQQDVGEIYAKQGLNGLMDLPGIGEGLAKKIEEFAKTGSMRKYDELKKEYPIDFKALTSIEGVGPKTAIQLYKKLGVKNLEDLKNAVESESVRKLPGFGAKSEQAIKESITMMESSKGRITLGEALPEAESIVKMLLDTGLVEKAVISGSTRRMRETIGDIDILAISDKPEMVMDAFVKFKGVSSTIVKGPTKTTVWLDIGTSCDLRVIEPKSFGAALQYFTGSKSHNIKVRTIAIKKGFKLNEYGLFGKDDSLISSLDEEIIYKKLGMQWMPPEMREDRGEVELARRNMIPKLVEYNDILGDLHTHTKDTDGINSIDEMADAAIKNGLRYFAVTNHTKSLRIAKGMNEMQFSKFFDRIDALNTALDGRIKILKGAEVDILKDGRLDLDRKTLESMDCVVGAVHSNTNMDEKEMTKRISKAMDSGFIDILAHPTGRLINEREGYRIDLDMIAECAERNGVALEINSYPKRLDLNDTNIMLASKYKVMFAIDTDAHNTDQLSFMRYGLGTARRGWLGRERILNALPLDKLEMFLA